MSIREIQDSVENFGETVKEWVKPVDAFLQEHSRKVSAVALVALSALGVILHPAAFAAGFILGGVWKGVPFPGKQDIATILQSLTPIRGKGVLYATLALAVLQTTAFSFGLGCYTGGRLVTEVQRLEMFKSLKA